MSDTYIFVQRQPDYSNNISWIHYKDTVKYMEKRLTDWKQNFEEVWRVLNEQDERIEKLTNENQRLKERVDRLEMTINIR